MIDWLQPLTEPRLKGAVVSRCVYRRPLVRSSRYPSAANPAAITNRRAMSHALSPVSALLTASSTNPSAIEKYHKANQRERSLGEGKR